MVFFMETNKFSKIITQDDSLPAAQAMLYGIGLNEKDMGKAHEGWVWNYIIILNKNAEI